MYRKLLGFCLLLLIASSVLAIDSECDLNNDPYENYNRHAFKLNQTLDKIFFKPIATVYKTILPWPITKGISNFFSNLEQLPTIVNDLLQGELYDATSDTWRFLINSTVGIAGFVDVASRIGLPDHHQDFGITLAKWGYTSSAYLVIPILGPRTVRDTISWGMDYGVFSVYLYINDVAWRNALTVGSFINARAQLLDFDQTIKQVSFDPYIFQRNAYLQRRNYLIRRRNLTLDEYCENDDDETG